MNDEYRWVKVTTVGALAPGEMLGTNVGTRPIAVYNVEGIFHATSDLCPHAYALLSTGFLEGHVVECPLHAGCFDIRSGVGVGEPLYDDIEVFPVRIQKGSVEVRLPIESNPQERVK